MIDAKKKYRTRDGHKVRIYETMGVGDHPVYGAVRNSQGLWAAQLWTAEGFLVEGYSSDNDLIEVSEPCWRWYNILANGRFAGPFPSRRAADSNAGARVGRIKRNLNDIIGCFDVE